MNKYKHLKEKAREWRKKKVGLKEICIRLQLPKSTVYGWIKDLNISVPASKKVTLKNAKNASQIFQAKCKQLRDDAYEEGRRTAPEMMKNSLFRDFIMLYITEGFRKTRHTVCICNTNPNLIKLGYYWIHKLANPDRILEVIVQCHKDNDEKKLLSFWSKQLNILSDNIKIRQKSNSGDLGGRKNRNMLGVCHIRVGDTYLRARIEAWMDYLHNEYNNLYIRDVG